MALCAARIAARAWTRWYKRFEKYVSCLIPPAHFHLNCYLLCVCSVRVVHEVAQQQELQEALQNLFGEFRKLITRVSGVHIGDLRGGPAAALVPQA